MFGFPGPLAACPAAVTKHFRLQFVSIPTLLAAQSELDAAKHAFA